MKRNIFESGSKEPTVDELGIPESDAANVYIRTASEIEAARRLRREVARAKRLIEAGEFEEVDPMTADDGELKR